MLKNSIAFASFSVNNLGEAKQFYHKTLGLPVKETDMGLEVSTSGNQAIYVYEKTDHSPASFTILNFVVTDIDDAVDALISKGMTMEKYDLGEDAVQDEKGILRGLSASMGPDIAWFKDPSGNTLALIQSAR